MRTYIDKQLEYRILGTVLQHGRSVYHDVCERVNPEQWGSDEARCVWSLLQILDEQGKMGYGEEIGVGVRAESLKHLASEWATKPVDPSSSACEGILEGGGVLLDMLEARGVRSMVPTYCAELAALSCSRMAQKSILRAYRGLDDPRCLPEELCSEVADSLAVVDTGEWCSLSDIEDPGEDKPVASWGLPERGAAMKLDSIYPLCGGRYSIVTAKPGGGKTSMAVQCMAENAKNQIKCAFVSLEMCKADVYRFFRNHGLCKQDMEYVRILNAERPKPDDLRRILVSAFRWGARLVVVDHLGLVKPTGQMKKHEAIGEASNVLLGAVKQQDKCHVMALCQMNKEGRKQIKKDGVTFDVPPTMDDIEGSGDVTNGTAFAVGLWRPQKYKIELAHGEVCVRMDILKARFNPQNPVELRFHGASHTFSRDRMPTYTPGRDERMGAPISEDEDLFG